MTSGPLVALTLLLVSAALIYSACEYFVNGIEWIGQKAGMSQNAVGTILAAFGTALPESVVTFVAVVFGPTPDARNIGVGAALGGPLVLATIAYPIVGIMLWITGKGSSARTGAALGRRAVDPNLPRTGIDWNQRRLSRDQGWFLLIFACKIALGFVAFALKPVLGWLFLLAYAAYTWSEMLTAGGETEGELEPLKLQPRQTTPGWLATSVQTALALAVIFAASRLFVHQLTVIGPWLGVPSAVVALLLSPVATELPEIMNAIIWIRQGKLRLALSNISGAMMIQATIPTALGLLFTPWLFDRALALAAVITVLAVSGLWVLLRIDALTPRRLSLFGLLYGVFVAGIVWLR